MSQMERLKGMLSFSPRASASVWLRDATVFKKVWFAALMFSFVDPFFYLLAMGIGLGAYIHSLEGVPYREFIAPGLIASAAMYAASFESTYNVYMKLSHSHIYDAIVATPVEVKELVVGELSWATTRSVIYGSFFLVVVTFFGAVTSMWALLIVPALVLGGFCMAVIGMGFSALVDRVDLYSYYFTLFITPMFLFSGIFFPLSRLPEALQVVAWFTPLFHLVRLCRNLATGESLAVAAGDTLWLLVCIAVLIAVPLIAMRRRLVK